MKETDYTLLLVNEKSTHVMGGIIIWWANSGKELNHFYLINRPCPCKNCVV